MRGGILRAFALSVFLCGVSSLAAESAPNIILIVADDLGWGDVGFNGRTEWSTPNLDRLARQGVVLKRCYAAATVCAPSRAAFLTGKYTIHDGVRRNDEDLPAEEVTIAEALKTRGYATALFGKWHHGKPRAGKADYVHPHGSGFDEFFGYTDAGKAWEKFPRAVWDGRREVPVSGYFDDLVTDRACSLREPAQGAAVLSCISPTSPAISTSRHRPTRLIGTGASCPRLIPRGLERHLRGHDHPTGSRHRQARRDARSAWPVAKLAAHLHR